VITTTSEDDGIYPTGRVSGSTIVKEVGARKEAARIRENEHTTVKEGRKRYVVGWSSTNTTAKEARVRNTTV
jgi:hypothetical protein